MFRTPFASCSYHSNTCRPSNAPVCLILVEYNIHYHNDYSDGGVVFAVRRGADNDHNKLRHPIQSKWTAVVVRGCLIYKAKPLRVKSTRRLDSVPTLAIIWLRLPAVWAGSRDPVPPRVNSGPGTREKGLPKGSEGMH